MVKKNIRNGLAKSGTANWNIHTLPSTSNIKGCCNYRGPKIARAEIEIVPTNSTNDKEIVYLQTSLAWDSHLCPHCNFI